MAELKTLREREKELQKLLGSPGGQKQLKDLESKYATQSGTPKPLKTSVITYVLVNERALGLIDEETGS